MSSFVYYKFKSQKDPQRITIDGPHTDVWNLKREIINHARLGDGTDFDLKIYKENSNDEYTDDTEIIPKDSTVLARRLPAAVPGKGRAARYVSGKPPVSAKPTSTSTRASKAVDMDSAMTEEERYKAMLKLTDAQWQQKQEEMSHEARVPLQGGKGFQKKAANVPEGEPPHGYVCYRCGKKGHWIQACPTNDDATFDNKTRIKRTTGIPRSMLKKVEQSEVEHLDEAERQRLMVNADGEYVFAQADEKAWKRHLDRVKEAKAAQKNAKDGNQELQAWGLECPIDKRLFVDPMKTPCCGKIYCHDCIENALLENDLTCPGCETENVSLERLEPDEETKKKMKEYEAERSAAKSPAPSVSTPKVAASESGSRVGSRASSKSPESVGSTGQSKKRTASQANAASPNNLTAPAMKRQKSGEENGTARNQSGSKASTPAIDTEGNGNQNMKNMMPPDMSQMMQAMQNMQNMPNMSGMPNMNFPMMPMMSGMMPNMMGMMPNMPFMPPNFNMMNNMYPQGNNGNFNPMNQNNNFNGHRGGYNNNNSNNHGRYNKHRNFNNHNQFQQQNQSSGAMPANGLAGVPTGPKSMQNTNQPPSGPGGNKFANRPRQAGNEEDNAYMRQPVNPHRATNRGRGRMREADYREL